MNIFRQGKLVDSDVGSGNCLALEIYGSDVQKLVKEGYTMDRFGSMKHGMQIHGWAETDKCHLYLRSEQGPDISSAPVELSLDYGGDLTFEFWRQPLIDRTEEAALVYPDLTEIVKYDPNSQLRALGIDSLVIMGAWIISRELRNPGWLDDNLDN